MTRWSPGVVMSTSGADHILPAAESRFTPVDELLHERRGESFRGFDEWAAAAPDVFDSDEELDEFLAFTYAERRRDVS